MEELERDRFQERVNNHWWLKEPMTLRHFLWSSQSKENSVINPASQRISGWLKALFEYKYLGKQRPSPALAIYGEPGSGKTQVLARGIARFAMMNLGIPSVQYVYWPQYVKHVLERESANGDAINWKAKLLILDDLDRVRMVPKSLSTWMLEELIAELKPRFEIGYLPTIITSNYFLGSDQAKKIMSETSTGMSSEATGYAYDVLSKALSRSIHANVEIKTVPKQLSKPEPVWHDELRGRALLENTPETMARMGFHLWERWGEETLF